MAESITERQNNWLSVLRGLWYVKEGLQRYVDEKGKEQYHTFLNNVNPECSFLDEMTREIKQNHVLKKPIWKNTERVKWQDQPVGYWEVAKCYLSTIGYKDKMRSNDIDISGLLSICMNSSFINKNLNKQHLEKVRHIRNHVLHVEHYELDGQTVDECLGSMIAVLEAIPDNYAKQAAYHIEKLRAKTETVEQAQSETYAKIMDTELECCICKEIYVRAMVLNCSHVFCSLCIKKCMKEKMECPFCRTLITSNVRVIPLDSLIDEMFEKFSNKRRKLRKESVKVKKKEEEAFDKENKPKPAAVTPVTPRSINIPDDVNSIL